MKAVSADRRSRKTEASIEKAFFELAAKKDINKITVKDITDLADTNRGTFYLHYIDILDLQDSLEDKIIARLCSFASDSDSANKQIRRITHMLEYILENREIFNAFICSARSSLFMDKLANAIETRFLPNIPDRMKEQEQEYCRLVSVFFVNGAAALIKDWLTSNSKASPAELAELIETIVGKGLTSFISV